MCLLCFCAFCGLEHRGVPAAWVDEVLDVAGGAVGLAVGHVAIGARCSWRDSIRWIKAVVATRAGEFAFGVSLHSRRNFHTLIVQGMKLVTAPFIIRVGWLARRSKRSEERRVGK